MNCHWQGSNQITDTFFFYCIILIFTCYCCCCWFLDTKDAKKTPKTETGTDTGTQYSNELVILKQRSLLLVS